MPLLDNEGVDVTTVAGQSVSRVPFGEDQWLRAVAGTDGHGLGWTMNDAYFNNSHKEWLLFVRRYLNQAWIQ